MGRVKERALEMLMEIVIDQVDYLWEGFACSFPQPDRWLGMMIHRSSHLWDYKGSTLACDEEVIAMPISYTVKVVGVSFEGRQQVVSSLTPRESLRLRREPHNIDDPNAIRVERLNGQQVGYISRGLARQIASALDKVGGMAPATVVQLTGGGPGYNYGVVISFSLSQQQRSTGRATEAGLRIPPQPEPPPWDYDRESQFASWDDFEEEHPWDYEPDPFAADKYESPSPSPYAIATGQTARTLAELVALCAHNRLTAVTYFVRGFILRWLEENTTALRQQHRHDLADKYEMAAISAQIVLEKFRAQNSDSPLEQQLALEEWLRTLPDYRPNPRLRISPLEIRVPPYPAGHKTIAEIQIANVGIGILAGSLKTRDPWLEILDKEFVCFSDEPSGHRIVVTTPKGPGEEGSIFINSNGGKHALRVIAAREQVRIQVAAAVLDFGQVLPRWLVKPLEVKNLGNVNSTVTVSTSQPAIMKVSPSTFSLPPHGSSGRLVRVEIDWAKVAQQDLEDQLTLLVDSDGGKITIPVQGTVVKPVLQVDTNRIRILLDRKGRGKDTVTVINSGSGVLEVRADRPIGFRKDQLEISPSEVSCEAGRSKSFSVSLHIPNLRAGATPPQGKLVFRSNGGDEEVVVTTEMIGPWLMVTPAKIDFGCLERGPLVTKQLHIQNAGNDILQGYIASEEPWLVVEETSFRLSPKESEHITLRLVPDHPVKLLLPPITRRELATTIRVTSNGGKATVPVKLVSKYHG